MENKLKKLFDYQKFEQNPKLQSVIDKVPEFESVCALNDEMLGSVAGGKDMPVESNEDEEDED